MFSCSCSAASCSCSVASCSCSASSSAGPNFALICSITPCSPFSNSSVSKVTVTTVPGSFGAVSFFPVVLSWLHYSFHDFQNAGKRTIPEARIVVIFRSGCYVVIMRDRYVCAKAGVLRFVGRTVPELYPVAVRFYCQGSFVGLRSRYVVQRCRERVEVVF